MPQEKHYLFEQKQINDDYFFKYESYHGINI